jgi:uncharacterized protein YggE
MRPARPLLLAATLMAAAALPALMTPGTARAADAAFAATTLNLSAGGESRAAPDMATITLGVSTQAPTAFEAMRQNAARMDAVIKALKAGSIEARDIATSNLNLSPQYIYEQNKPPRLNAYQASNQVTVTVRELGRLGPAVDAVVGAGANEVNSISFGLADPKKAEDEARLEAVKALQAKAALYAQATGLRLVRLVNLSESGGFSPQPPRPLAMARMIAEAVPTTPVEAGELRVRVDLSAVYELAK